MVDTVELLGIKVKIYFVEPIKSLKLVAEFDEKLCMKYNYNSINISKEVLTLEKQKGRMVYSISLKSDHLSFYASATDTNLNVAIEEYIMVMNEFKNIMFSYMGEKQEINNIVLTKGYNATNSSFIDYLESTNYESNKNGVGSSIKYGGTNKMNLLLRKYFIDEEYKYNYWNNLCEYTNLLI